MKVFGGRRYLDGARCVLRVRPITPSLHKTPQFCDTFLTQAPHRQHKVDLALTLFGVMWHEVVMFLGLQQPFTR
jgi:hypothetical protein